MILVAATPPAQNKPRDQHAGSAWLWLLKTMLAITPALGGCYGAAGHASSQQTATSAPSHHSAHTATMAAGSAAGAPKQTAAEQTAAGKTANGSYRCVGPDGLRCPELRFKRPKMMRAPTLLNCSTESLFVVGDHGSGRLDKLYTEVVALLPDDGRLSWRAPLTAIGHRWNSPQLTVLKDGASVIVASGLGGQLAPAHNNAERALVVIFNAKGERQFLSLLASPSEVVSQHLPRVVGTAGGIYIALREQLAPAADEAANAGNKQIMTLYRLGRRGQVELRMPLGTTSLADGDGNALAVAPDGALWFSFDRQLLRISKKGKVTDRYPLDPHRKMAGLLFDGRHDALVASSSNGNDHGDHNAFQPGKPRDLLWRAAPGKPLQQVAEQLRQPRHHLAALAQAGAWRVLFGSIDDFKSHRITPLDEAQRPLPAFRLQGAGHRWGFCSNGDVLLLNDHELMRQPLFPASANLAR